MTTPTISANEPPKENLSPSLCNLRFPNDIHPPAIARQIPIINTSEPINTTTNTVSSTHSIRSALLAPSVRLEYETPDVNNEIVSSINFVILDGLNAGKNAATMAKIVTSL